MKFLFISPRFSGGIGGHAAMLADKLLQSGHTVKKMETTHIPIKNMKNPYEIYPFKEKFSNFLLRTNLNKNLLKKKLQ